MSEGFIPNQILTVDAAVIGASLGGVQSAISLLSAGYTVFLSEECKWIGGQLTSQAVPPDEHQWIEQFGCTARYRAFRNAIRKHYTGNPDFNPPEAEHFLNPGLGWVSRICHEPEVAQKLLMAELEPAIASGQLILVTECRPTAVKFGKKGEISAVLLQSTKNTSDGNIEVKAGFFIDASDLGDVLPIAGVDYVTGAESFADTKEPAAPSKADPADMQPVTWVLSLGLNCGESPIPKPENYDRFASIRQVYCDRPIFSRFAPGGSSAVEFPIMEGEGELPLWSYRRIRYPGYWKSPQSELSLLNWPQNDFYLDNIIDPAGSSGGRREKSFLQAKELSFCFLYWLQTEAERPAGGRGYPEIGLLRNVLGSDDGAAQFPYIREGRRIRPLRRVTARDIIASCHKGLPHQADSVGIGHYPLDIHITTQSHSFGYGEDVLPFEIPLSAYIAPGWVNFVPGSKNIGTSHLSNACFRTHPVEWNIGEVAGHIAAFCLQKSITPMALYEKHISEFQVYVQERGVEIAWPAEHIQEVMKKIRRNH